MSGPVQVPHEVHVGIEAVRISGLTNMLDRERVAEISDGMGYDETAAWIRADPARYAQAIFHGIEGAR